MLGAFRLLARSRATRSNKDYQVRPTKSVILAGIFGANLCSFATWRAYMLLLSSSFFFFLGCRNVIELDSGNVGLGLVSLQPRNGPISNFRLDRNYHFLNLIFATIYRSYYIF